MQLLANRSHPSVDAAAGTFEPHVGVDAEGEIQHRSPGVKLLQFARRGKHEHLPEQGGTPVGRLHPAVRGEHLAHVIEPVGQTRLALHSLVGPVRSIAHLGHGIHPRSPDLHLHEIARRNGDGRMKRLITVGLGDRQPVAQTVDIRLIFLGHKRIHFPAELVLRLADRRAVDDETHREHVVNLLERHLLLQHFLPDRIGALGAGLHHIVDALAVKLLPKRPDKRIGQLLAVFLRSLKLVGDAAVLLRVGKSQVTVFHLALDGVEARLVRQRDIEQQRLENL